MVVYSVWDRAARVRFSAPRTYKTASCEEKRFCSEGRRNSACALFRREAKGGAMFFFQQERKTGEPGPRALSIFSAECMKILSDSGD